MRKAMIANDSVRGLRCARFEGKNMARESPGSMIAQAQ